MFFRTAVVALLAAFVSAEKAMETSGSIPLTSNVGQELMVKATVIEEARVLANNNYDASWMSKFSLRYVGCSSLVQVAGQQGGGNNKNNENGLLYTQHLVRFSICPVDGCNSSCTGGGQYVVNLADFVDLYTEYKLTAAEQACEAVREACYCDDANDDEACESACYAKAGLDDCVNYEGDEEFEVQRYLECQEMKDQGGNNNNNNKNNYYYGNGNDYYYGQYYVGPYCPDGKNIFLGLFYDQGCSAQADISQYALRSGGSELPYSSKSLVTAGDCLACGSTNDNGEAEIAEVCYTLQQEAARCEENMEITYPDTSACDYIKNILPRLDAASRSLGNGTKTSYAKSGKAAKAFAFVFAFTTVLFAAYAYFLYRKIKRGVVALAAQGN